jgi:hypothetical protein
MMSLAVGWKEGVIIVTNLGTQLDGIVAKYQFLVIGVDSVLS